MFLYAIASFIMIRENKKVTINPTTGADAAAVLVTFFRIEKQLKD